MFNKYDHKSMVAVENHASSAVFVTTPSSSKGRSKSMLEGAEDDIEEIDETNFIDPVKVACLLCKRKFELMDVLQKHIAMSDLHKVLCFFFFISFILIALVLT